MRAGAEPGESRVPRRRRGLLLCALLAVLPYACAADRAHVWVSELPPPNAQNGDTLQPGDRIAVFVAAQPTLSGEFEVRQDGTFGQPMVGNVRVGGLTLPAAEQLLTSRLTKLVVEPRVSVARVTHRAVTVNVIGEVRANGRFALEPGENVLSVLARAGGLTEFAADDRVYVVRQGTPEPLVVRFSYVDLTSGDPRSLGFALRDGDTIVVE